MQNPHLYTPEQRDKWVQLTSSIEFKKECVERLSSPKRPTNWKSELDKRAEKSKIRKRLIDEIKQEAAELNSLLKI